MYYIRYLDTFCFQNASPISIYCTYAHQPISSAQSPTIRCKSCFSFLQDSDTSLIVWQKRETVMPRSAHTIRRHTVWGEVNHDKYQRQTATMPSHDNNPKSTPALPPKHPTLAQLSTRNCVINTLPSQHFLPTLLHLELQLQENPFQQRR